MPRKTKYNFTRESVSAIAALYGSRREWRESEVAEHRSAYRWAADNCVISEMAAHMPKGNRPGPRTSKEQLFSIAKTFPTRQAWRLGHHESYSCCTRYGWLRDPELEEHFGPRRRKK